MSSCRATVGSRHLSRLCLYIYPPHPSLRLLYWFVILRCRNSLSLLILTLSHLPLPLSIFIISIYILSFTYLSLSTCLCCINCHLSYYKVTPYIHQPYHYVPPNHHQPHPHTISPGGTTLLLFSCLTNGLSYACCTYVLLTPLSAYICRTLPLCATPYAVPLVSAFRLPAALIVRTIIMLCFGSYLACLYVRCLFHVRQLLMSLCVMLVAELVLASVLYVTCLPSLPYLHVSCLAVCLSPSCLSVLYLSSCGLLSRPYLDAQTMWRSYVILLCICTYFACLYVRCLLPVR